MHNLCDILVLMVILDLLPALVKVAHMNMECILV